MNLSRTGIESVSENGFDSPTKNQYQLDSRSFPFNSPAPVVENENGYDEQLKANQISGKWTKEEEDLAQDFIRKFQAGSLTDCVEGCTLRSYLSEKLHCKPMRISKKLAGQKLGKIAFRKRVYGDDQYSCDEKHDIP